MPQIRQISPENAKQLLDSGDYIYLDVRSVPEFNQAHVPGAYNIPVAEINPATGRMEPNPIFAFVL